jgi:hypothetical protein
VFMAGRMSVAEKLEICFGRLDHAAMPSSQW